MTRLALTAADEAAGSAGLRMDDVQRYRPDRCRVSIGTSKGGVITFGRVFDQIAEGSMDGNASDVLARLLNEFPPDTAARQVSRRLGMTGGAHATVAACATGALSLIRAAQWIADDEADVVLAGSSDASITPLWLAAFDRMGVHARAHPTRGPGYACRPFDRTREGFVVGEGAAVLVLESERSVRRRSVTPLARLAGFATGSDPAGLSRLTPDAGPQAEVIRRAMAQADIRPQQIAAVQAHGTATLANDQVEIASIREVLGDSASSVPVVSFKGAIGHLLGAAGSVETALAVLAIKHGVCPGTTTLLEPDPELGRLVLPNGPFQVSAGPILKISMGFGGHLAAIVVAPP
jgi:3-oxoacyl-(acyl-carrier-protein) synthase